MFFHTTVFRPLAAMAVAVLGLGTSTTASIITSTATGQQSGLFINSSSVQTNIPGLPFGGGFQTDNSVFYDEDFPGLAVGYAGFTLISGPATEYSVTIDVKNTNTLPWGGFQIYVGGGTPGHPIYTSWFTIGTGFAPTITGPGTGASNLSLQPDNNWITWTGLEVMPGDTIQVQFNLDLIANVSGGWQIAQLAIPKPECVHRPTGMAAWYPGDDAWPSDLLGQHDGYFVGFPVGVVDWKVGGGTLEVHSPDTYVIVPDSPGILSFGNPTSNFSIDAWVNVAPENSSGIRPIADKRVEIANSVWGYSFYLYNGLLGFQMADGGWTNYVSNEYVADGLWHLVAVTVERTPNPQVVLYVDNQVVLTGAPRLGNANNNADLWIGSGHPIGISQPYMTGLIDELELFNRALAPTDIEAIFLADSAGKCKCTDPPSDMVAWWPLDETLACSTGCPAEDIVAGLNDGVQACSVTPGFGKVEGAFQMTGQGYPGFSCPRGYVIAPPGPSPALGASSFTIDAWINPDPCTSCFPANILCHPRPIVSNRAGTGGDTDQTGLVFFVAGPAPPGPVWSPLYNKPTPGWLGISLPPAAGVVPQMIFSSSNPVVDNAWQHVAVTVDPSGPGVTFFYNGMPLGPSLPYTPVTVNSPHCVNLGHTPSRNVAGDCANGCGVERYFNGWLDEIEIFNRALSPSEIAALYGAGAHGKCKPDVMLNASREGATADRATTNPVPLSQQGEGGICPCEQPGDLDGDGQIGITDFLALLGAWGPNPGNPGDLDGDGTVGITDFLALLGAWGPCA